MRIAGRARDLSSCLRAGWLALPLLALSASCTTVEDVVPTASARPTQPDGYPNLNVPVAAASPQLDEAQRQQLSSELTALRQRQTASPGAPQGLSEAERLRLLARSHGDRTLSEIEASE